MKTNYKNFAITSNFDGNKKADWGEKVEIENWNHHTITVKNTETGKRTSFDFWGSLVNPEIETEKELLFAFYCFVSDGLVGKESFDEFCSEMGYDEDSRRAEKIYKDCQKSYNKFARLFDGDIYDFIIEYCTKRAKR